MQVLTFGVFVLCLYFSLFGFIYLAELCIFDNFLNWLILSVLWFMILDWLSSSLLCDLQKSLPRDILPRHGFLSVMRLPLRESLCLNLWTVAFILQASSDISSLHKFILPQSINDVKIYHPERQTPSKRFLCESFNCSHSCDQVSLFAVSCSCPSGMVLGQDNKTCKGSVKLRWHYITGLRLPIANITNILGMAWDIIILSNPSLWLLDGGLCGKVRSIRLLLQDSSDT